MRVVVYDFETFWSSKEYTLSKTGPIEYIRDPRFTAQLIGMSINGEPTKVFHGTEAKAMIEQCILDSDIFVAHNGGGFDHLILSERYGLRPKNLWDTIWLMRWTGISSISNETHKALTELLGNGVKQAGTVVSDGKTWPQDFTLDEQRFFVQYCADDVSQCVKNLAAMLPYLTDDALQFMTITARMATEPAFVLDEQLLEEFIKQLDAEAEEARQKIMEVFHFENLQLFFKAIRSSEKFASMLRQLGVEPPVKFSAAKTATARQRILDEKSSLRADQVDALAVCQKSLSELDRTGVSTYAFSKSDIEFLALREHSDPRVRLLVETRLEMNSSILRSRAETLLKFAKQKKPIPIMLSAFKAHTSRYTAGVSEGKSDSMQPQNLPKRNPVYLPLRRAIKAPAGYKIVACDSSQIEARVNAWFCNQLDVVEHFRQGRDPYSELAANFDKNYTAQQIHDGKDTDKHCKYLRNLGKFFVLSAGYSIGADLAAQRLIQQGTWLSKDLDEHFRMTKSYLMTYRTNNSQIVNMWRTCQRIIEAMSVGGSGQFGGPNGMLFEYGMMSICGLQDVPSIKMPSGFILRYPNLHPEEGAERIEYYYDSRKGKNVVKTKIFGGLLLNNCIQGLSFQALMWQACRMNEAGINLKCNIHDSWATVVSEAQAQATADKMLWHMRQVPAWLQGCPIDAEYSIGDDFTVC